MSRLPAAAEALQAAVLAPKKIQGYSMLAAAKKSRERLLNATELLSAIQAKFPDLLEIPKAQGQARGDELYLAVPLAQLAALCRFIRFDLRSHLIFFHLSLPSIGKSF